MTAIYSFQKPYRVWSGDRKIRKSVIASSLLELKLKGSEKLGYDSLENVSMLKVVLESDGTEVEDDGYFQTADKDTIFILLKSNESWLPLGVDALKSALLTLPGLVSDSLNKLEASDRLPNWKISDHSGIITVVLSWDTRDRPHLELSSVSPVPIGPALAAAPLYLEQEIMESLGWTSSSGAGGQDGEQQQQPSTSAAGTTTTTTTTNNNNGMNEQQQQLLEQIQRQQQEIIQQQQMLAAAAQQSQSGQQQQQPRSKLTLEGLSPVTGPSDGSVPRPPGTRVIPTIQHQYVSFDSDSDEDMSDKDEECSPIHEDHTHCDFHCSSLHRQMQLIKKCSVATSPIEEKTILNTFAAATSSFAPSFSSSAAYGAQQTGSSSANVSRGVSPTSGLKKGTGSSASKYVRFQDMESKVKHGHGQEQLQVIESDSESTSTMMEEEQLSERYLLLIDQIIPGLDSSHRHLSIKDIGIILEKLNSKIIDVDKLEREKESSDVYNWIIRAAIRGDALKEVGVIYNDTYYGIMEHPGYF